MATKTTRLRTRKRSLIKHIERHCACIVPMNDPGMRGVLQMRHYLAKATEHIDYGCDFKRGKCTRARMAKPKEFWKGCCCKGCRRNVGYFERIPEEWIEELSELWDDKNGFYDPNSGCRILRHMRASTCLAHQCGTANHNRVLTQPEYLLMCSIRASKI